MPTPADFPSFTEVYHTTPYDAISPMRPELPAKGKAVVIAGGGSGIGASMALSFAKAGASIGIIGRRESNLQSSKT